MSWAKKLENVLKSVNSNFSDHSDDEEDEEEGEETSSYSEEPQRRCKRSNTSHNKENIYKEIDDSDISEDFDDDPDDPDYAPDPGRPNEAVNFSSEDEIDDPVNEEVNDNSASEETAIAHENHNFNAEIAEDDDIVEVPNTASTIAKAVPRKLPVKRNQYNRNLQCTLHLKSFKTISPPPYNIVLTSYVISVNELANMPNDKENSAFELCLVGKSYNTVIKDMVLIYGDIKDTVFNDIVKKSIHNEKCNVEPDFFVDPLVTKIADNVIRKNKYMKLIGIPLNGKAVLNSNPEPIRLLLYPVISTSSENYLKLVSICNKEIKSNKVLETGIQAISEHCSSSRETPGLTGGNYNVNVHEVYDLSESDNEESADNIPPKRSRFENKPRCNGKVKGVSEFYLKQLKRKTVSTTNSSANSTTNTESSQKTELAPKNTESTPQNTESAAQNKESAAQNKESASQNTESATQNTELASQNTELASHNRELAFQNTETLSSKNTESVPLRNRESMMLSVSSSSSSTLATEPLTSSAAPITKTILSSSSELSATQSCSSSVMLSEPSCSKSNAEKDPPQRKENDRPALTSKKEIKLIAIEKLASISDFIINIKDEQVDQMVIQEMEQAAQAAYDINGPSRVYRVPLLYDDVVYAYEKHTEFSGQSALLENRHYVLTQPK